MSLTSRVFHKPHVSRADENWFSYSRGDAHTPGKTKQYLSRRRRVPLAVPADRKSEKDKSLRRLRIGHIQSRGRRGELLQIKPYILTILERLLPSDVAYKREAFMAVII